MTRATVADALTWLDLHNGSVQAAAAIATLAATLLVALVAIWAAWSVGRQARQTARLAALAQRQVEEAAEARRALVRPHLHVDGCAADGSGELAVRLRVRNVGAGPALSVRGRLEHPGVAFAAADWSDEGEPVGAGTAGDRDARAAGGSDARAAGGDSAAAAGGGDATAGVLLEPGQGRQLRFRAGRAEAAGGPVEPARLVVEYRDLADRWWTTELPVRLDRRDGPDGRAHLDAIALDREERVRAVERPPAG